MSRHRSQGFTLIELMMVIVIISVLLLLARPGMSGWQMSSRQYDLTLEIANMGRRAASRARETGTAHQLRLSTNSGRFLLEVYQGMNRRCRQTNWFGGVAGLPRRIESTPFNVHNRTAEKQKLMVNFQRFTVDLVQNEATASGPTLPAIEICYEPSGRTYTSVLGASLTRQTTPLEANIIRTGGTSQRARIVSFPPSGTPRPRL